MDFPDPSQAGINYRFTEMRNTYEIFSYAAEAWGKPLGIMSNMINFTELYDLTSELSYDDHHYSHSRQFRSNIIAEKKYWELIKGISEGTINN